MLYLSADHNGYEIKKKIRQYLTQKGLDFVDMGAYEYDKDDDYPDFAYSAAYKVARDPVSNRGIMICGSGVGMAITANKVRGVYCAQVWNRKMARGAREHNAINMLSFGADYTDEAEIIASIEEFLQAPGNTAERHLRRFKRVQQLEAESVSKKLTNLTTGLLK